jgi:hypothetical protein
VPPGRVKAAEQAIRYLEQLGDSAVALTFRIAHEASVGEYDRMRERLTALGHADINSPYDEEAMAATLQSFVRWRDSWDVLLRAATQIADQQAGISRNRCWRLPTLVTLIDTLDVRHAPVVSINAALLDDRQQLCSWLRAVARAAGLDRAVLAAEAYAAMNAGDTGDCEVLGVLFAPPYSPAPDLNPQLLAQEDINVLIGALEASSDWIADVAARLLLARHDSRDLEKIERLRHALPPSRRIDVTRLVIALSADPPATCSDLLGWDDPATRTGAALELKRCQGTDQADNALQRALVDPDLTVRLAAGASQERALQADYWSCPDCAIINDIPVPHCAHCSTGRRPWNHAHPGTDQNDPATAM